MIECKTGRRRAGSSLGATNLITASFVRLRIPYTCTLPGPVLAPLRRDLARHTFRIWHRYGSCPALRRRFSAPLPLSPDAQSPRASIVLTFHAFFLWCHLNIQEPAPFQRRADRKTKARRFD